MAFQTSRIVELAQLITANVSVIDQQLHEAGLPSPSFDISAPPSFPKNNTMDAARDAVLSATTELRGLVLGAKESLQILAGSHNELVSLNAVSRFKIESSFAVGKEATYGELAETTGLSVPVVRRLLRHAMINNIFTETQHGTVIHTAASALLARDRDVRDFIAVAVEDLWKAATCTVDALQKWPQSEKATETGFALANNTQDPFYIEIGKDSERTARFAGSMRAFSTGSEYGTLDLIENFDWESLGTGLVVDVGGSHGAVSLALAELFPSLRFVVQDLQSVISELPALPADSIASRVSFMAHDFFTPQPVAGADVYYYRWIFHGWAQGNAIKILRALIPALKKGAFVIINDICLADRNTLSVWRDRRIRAMDISQLVMLNSGEREIVEWQELFHAADERFEFQGVRRSSNDAVSGLAVVVAQWKGDDDITGPA